MRPTIGPRRSHSSSRASRCSSNPRGGKVAAQDRAVRQTESEIVAFTDANATWSPDALRRLVRPFADPDVAYVCGQLHIAGSDGPNQEGVYWRYELGVRDAESRLGSVTGGNGSIYAVRRSDYVEVDPRFGHDLALPYLMVQHGRRAVYEPSAAAREKADADERDRVSPQGPHVRALLADRRPRADAAPARAALRPGDRLAPPPALRVGDPAHRPAATSLALIAHGFVYDLVLAAQLGLLLAAAVGVGIARYYVLVTWATLVALWNYVRRGVPATWEAAEGTR